MQQTESFESERTSWYDQEQHYKLRIANLSTPRKPRIPDTPKPLKDGELDGYHTPRLLSPSPSRSACSSPVPGETTSTEAALQDQLASLTVAHTSLTATGRALQIELSELKRVYHDLQEENESYEVLLGEKTMNGEMGDLFRKSLDHGGGGRGLESVGEGQETDEEEEDEIERVVRSNGRGSRGPSTPKTRRKSSVAGSGLDLAAELEAAMSDDHESEEETKKPTHKRNASIGDGEFHASSRCVHLESVLTMSILQSTHESRSSTFAKPTRLSPSMSPRLSTGSVPKKDLRRSSPSNSSPS